MAKLMIRLGPQGLRYAKPSPEMKLLGTVQEGLAIGALAQLEDGSYAQVNGDFLRPLSAKRVEYCVGPKLLSSLPAPMPTAPRAPTGPVPVVVVKKRRLVSINPG
jgi:hypothetical protein